MDASKICGITVSPTCTPGRVTDRFSWVNWLTASHFSFPSIRLNSPILDNSSSATANEDCNVCFVAAFCTCAASRNPRSIVSLWSRVIWFHTSLRPSSASR